MMTTLEILRHAAELTDAQVQKMAHALGWPRTVRESHRVRWVGRPSRNWYCGAADDPDWTAALSLGFAIQQRSGILADGEIYWLVTPHGRAVLRVRLQARLAAHRAGLEEAR